MLRWQWWYWWWLQRGWEKDQEISLMTERKRKLGRVVDVITDCYSELASTLIILCTLLSKYSITFLAIHRYLLAICFYHTIKKRDGSFQTQIYWFSNTSSQESHIFRKINRNSKPSLETKHNNEPMLLSAGRIPGYLFMVSFPITYIKI